jgi:hypothetical protein
MGCQWKEPIKFDETDLAHRIVVARRYLACGAAWDVNGMFCHWVPWSVRTVMEIASSLRSSQ